MRIQTVLDVFQEEVPKAFGFLVERHGFTLERLDDYGWLATSPHAEVRIELDWGSIAVSLCPAGAERPVRLSFIVGASDPTILFLPRDPWGPEEAHEEIERQSELLTTYCADLLSGDFSGWKSLEAHQRLVLEQWRRESERLVTEARLKLVRRRAEIAWQQKNYSEAAQLYTSIREELTQAEIARHEYCRRRTLLVAVPRERRAEEIA